MIHPNRNYADANIEYYMKLHLNTYRLDVLDIRMLVVIFN